MANSKNSNTPIPLSSPIKVDGKDVSEITLREPKSGEMRGLALVQVAQMDAAQMTKLLSRITQPSLSEAQLSELKLSDFFALSAKAASFLVSSEQLKALQGAT